MVAAASGARVEAQRAKTLAQQEQVLRSVLFARDHAVAALNAEDDGDYQEALRQWNIIYNGYFPQR